MDPYFRTQSRALLERAKQLRGEVHRRRTVKLTVWLDPDVYEKWTEIRGRRRMGGMLLEAVYLFYKRHGTIWPRRKPARFSLRLPEAALLRLLSKDLHISQRDIINVALREFDPESGRQLREEIVARLGMRPIRFQPPKQSDATK